VIAARVAGEYELGPPAVVPVRFSLVQQVCGQYEHDRCAARDGQPCDVHGCPFLLSDPSERRPHGLAARAPDEVDRRTVVLGGAAVAAATVAGAVAAGAAAGLGRAVGGAKSPTGQTVTLTPGRSGPSSASSPSTTTTAPSSGASSTTVPSGTSIGAASQVPVGGAARFTDPQSGDPGLVIQLARGKFVAYDAVCPHAGCTVGYSPAADLIVCPCHGSEFDPRTGAVVSPPASRGLTTIQVTLGANGELVVPS
jgi:thiosulfate dehydrogenase (quinone) large subunit